MTQPQNVYSVLTWSEETGSRPGSSARTDAGAESRSSWGLVVCSSAGPKMTASLPELWWSAPGPPASPAQRRREEHAVDGNIQQNIRKITYIWCWWLLPFCSVTVYQLLLKENLQILYACCPLVARLHLRRLCSAVSSVLMWGLVFI